MLSGLEVVGRTRSKKSKNSHCYLQYYLLIATDCDFTSLAMRSKKILSYYNVFTQCSNVNFYHMLLPEFGVACLTTKLLASVSPLIHDNLI